MARRVQHRAGNITDSNLVAIRKQHTKLRAVQCHIAKIKNAAEDLLHLCNVRANRRLALKLPFQNWRGCQMIGVHVRLEDKVKAQFLVTYMPNDIVDRFRR